MKNPFIRRPISFTSTSQKPELDIYYQPKNCYDSVHCCYALFRNVFITLLVSNVFFMQGESIYKELLRAGKERKIRIRVAQSAPSSSSPDYDTVDLSKSGMIGKILTFLRM